MKRLIIYDLDGTLVDTLEDITAAANHMLDVLGAPAVAAQDIRRAVGRGVEELVARCLGTEDPARIEQGVAVYRTHYAQHLADHSRLYPGARALLDYFTPPRAGGTGCRQAVVTNKPNPFSRDLLAALGIEGYFVAIVAGDAEYPRKPDPSAVQALMQRASAAPEETVVIGDSPVDVEAGRRAGVFTVGMRHGFADEDELAAASPGALVGSFPELLALAKRLGW